MIQGVQTLLDTIATWSRAMQWAFWATTLTLLFLVWDSTIAELGDSWSTQINAKEAQLEDLRRPTTLTSSVKNAVASFGEVELPRQKSDGATALTEAVHDILSRHRVKNDDYTRTKTSRMKSDTLVGISASDENLEQVIGDISFEATQEEVLHVISEFESSPWIDAISNLRLTKKEGRMIQVVLSVEAWVVSKSQKRGRR